MTFARRAHSDQRGHALVREAHAHEVELRVAPVDLAPEDALEALLAQGPERGVALFVFEPFLRRAVEPFRGCGTVVGIRRYEKCVDGILRPCLRPALASERKGGQKPDDGRGPQVPEQEGANSSSSAAEMNSSLHQNDASECPFRTH